MPSDNDPTPSPVSSNDIAAFAGRLAEWGDSLSPAERSLAQVLAQYARDLQPEDVRRGQLVADLTEATKSVVDSVKERWGAEADTWVEIGPIWQKANPTAQSRDQMELVQWIYTRPQHYSPQIPE
ncbi:hypothetical protein [Streptomyces gilvosporeus]|uniref:Uncharacterized protein n=1 Tax=Streptomyces gilvosporeus TaxID=553510 RepID=A0A1V0TZI3_9ACTN|nr:hypothetical protein [Streptomyces gilvosporeus]ARF58082.1 hypothetical protein B1H19_31375 [Streptomyces gilvosporeus]